MAIILTIIAGFSTFLGSLIIFIKKQNNKILTIALSFSATIMIGISLLDLIPEASHLLSINNFLKIMYILIAINIGIIVGLIFNKKINTNNKLYKVGIISLLGVILHNIPEGIATYMAVITDFELGITLTTLISLHNIPEGIAIAMPIYYATKNKSKVFLYTIIASLAEPLGALITHFILKDYINNLILGLLFAFIAGLMLYIAVFELIPTVYAKNNKKGLITGVLLGIFILIII